jgi:hypothetical protein
MLRRPRYKKSWIPSGTPARRPVMAGNAIPRRPSVTGQSPETSFSAAEQRMEMRTGRVHAWIDGNQTLLGAKVARSAIARLVTVSYRAIAGLIGLLRGRDRWRSSSLSAIWSITKRARTDGKGTRLRCPVNDPAMLGSPQPIEETSSEYLVPDTVPAPICRPSIASADVRGIG